MQAGAGHELVRCGDVAAGCGWHVSRPARYTSVRLLAIQGETVKAGSKHY